MKGAMMEIEEKLKDAADWRPGSEMPLGLEQRVLVAPRPPLRPIGLTRPRTFALGTAMAGALCTFVVLRIGQPVLPTRTPSPVAPQVAQEHEPVVENRTSEPVVPPRKKESPRVQPQPAPAARSRELPHVSTPRREPRSPLTHRFPVAVDDSVKTANRVAVDVPSYLPAYYAQPSADGQGVQYTPVAMALDDPDVIYSETQQENQPL